MRFHIHQPVPHSSVSERREEQNIYYKGVKTSQIIADNTYPVSSGLSLSCYIYIVSHKLYTQEGNKIKYPQF